MHLTNCWVACVPGTMIVGSSESVQLYDAIYSTSLHAISVSLASDEGRRIFRIGVLWTPSMMSDPGVVAIDWGYETPPRPGVRGAEFQEEE